MSHDKFARARSLFPHTEKTVYFNSASYGPFATTVRDAIKDNLDLRVAADRDDTGQAMTAADQLRGTYAKLIGATRSDIGLGFNTSFGINLAAFGLPLKSGDEVLLIDIEFPALVYTFQAAAEVRGYRVKIIPTTDRRCDFALLEKAVTKRTRLIAVSWVQFFNGYKLDLSELTEFCRRHRLWLVLDGIQGMGVEPINVRRRGIDIFTSGCQKWMLAPQGSGFFYLSPEMREVLQPAVASWLGVDWGMDFTDLFKFDLPWYDSARRFELGYFMVTNLFGMKAAVDIFTDLGVAGIQKHNYALIDRLARYVKGSDHYRITCDLSRKHRSSIFTFTCNDVKALHRRIIKAGIILSQREGSIRVAAHLFNNEDDIDRLIEVLEEHQRRG